MSAPRDVLDALTDHERTIHIRPPFERNGVVFWVCRTASIEENHILACCSIAFKCEGCSWHFVVQFHFDGVGCVVSNLVPCKDVQEERCWWVVCVMVERVGQYFWADPLIAPSSALSVVTTKRNQASEVIAFRVKRSCCIDGDCACLRHDEFVPLGEAGIKRNVQHWSKIGQLDGSCF